MTSATTSSGGGSRTVASFTGSLSEVPLAAVLRRIAVEERSGDLHVTTPEFSKTVHFDRGFVVFASSNLKDDRLGESLLESGRISRHEFALASMLMKTTKQKLGGVLVEAGIVGEEELGRHVAAQVNRIVLSLFLAKEGRYELEEGRCSVPVELMVSLSVYRILMDGVRRMSRKSLVLAGLPPLDTEVRIVDQPPFTLDIGKLRADEKSVLKAVKDGATIRDIVAIAGGNEGIALRACYGLLCGGILEPVDVDPRKRQLRVQEETGTFVLSEIRHKVQVPAEPIDTPSPRPSPAPERPSLPIERPAEPRSSPVETSDGFTLGDLYAWFAGLWNRVRGWFGRSPEAFPEAPRPSVSPTKAPRATPPDPTAVPQEPEPAPAGEVESIGVPAWSLQDDVHEAGNEGGGAESLRPPSWSLKSDEPVGPAGEDDRLGVPAWSMKDPEPGPPSARIANEPSRKRQEPEAESPSEPIAPPAWSIRDAPEPPAPVEDVPLDTRQTLDVESFSGEDPLPDLDHELFVDGPDSGHAEISMLRQIPIEDVELSQELELDVELELEAEELPASQEQPVEPSPRAKPASEAAAEPAPPREPRLPSPSQISKLDDVEESQEPVSTGPAHEQDMRRMKQSGGEARLLRDVKLHFRMRDWQGAVPLLEQLVAISPGKALYRGMLARAMSRDPARRKNAEEHYIEALRLSPQDPELHYWLGLYYKSFGLNARAITEFRTALRINPKHEGARKQLGGGAKKEDALGSVLKKLFG